MKILSMLMVFAAVLCGQASVSVIQNNQMVLPYAHPPFVGTGENYSVYLREQRSFFVEVTVPPECFVLEVSCWVEYTTTSPFQLEIRHADFIGLAPGAGPSHFFPPSVPAIYDDAVVIVVVCYVCWGSPWPICECFEYWLRAA